jgi:integrase
MKPIPSLDYQRLPAETYDARCAIAAGTSSIWREAWARADGTDGHMDEERIDAWTAAVGVTERHRFRPINGGNQVLGTRLSEKVVWQMLKSYVVAARLPDIAPHDLRRTMAKLFRAAGGELEQIQMLLGQPPPTRQNSSVRKRA